MTTFNNPPPKDLYLTPQESQRQVAMHIYAVARQTGEDQAEVQQRMAKSGMGDLVEFLGSVRVTRERYAYMYEDRHSGRKSVDSGVRLKGVPDPVRQTISRSMVTEGDTVHAMREWQTLQGERSQGLLLLGPAGAGKTMHASLLLLGSVLDVEPEGQFVGESLLSLHLGSGTKKDKEESLAPLRVCPLLVVDYCGQRKTQANWEAAVLEFLRIRWEAGRKCVLTFRGDLDAFKQCYGADGWATVERFCTVLKVRREG